MFLLAVYTWNSASVLIFSYYGIVHILFLRRRIRCVTIISVQDGIGVKEKAEISSIFCLSIQALSEDGDACNVRCLLLARGLCILHVILYVGV